LASVVEVGVGRISSVGGETSLPEVATARVSSDPQPTNKKATRRANREINRFTTYIVNDLLFPIQDPIKKMLFFSNSVTC
jgi:hypothetical protein